MSNDIEREAFEAGWAAYCAAPTERDMGRSKVEAAIRTALRAARAQQGEAEPVACPGCDNEVEDKNHKDGLCDDCKPPTWAVGGVPEGITHEMLDAIWQGGIDAENFDDRDFCQPLIEAHIALDESAAQSPEQPKPRNRYGVDAPYFHGKLSIILRDLENYTPDELARSLARLAVVADRDVLTESEFAPEHGQAAPEWIRCSERLPEPRRSARKTPNGILAKHTSGRITQFRDVTEELVTYMRNGPRKPTKYEKPIPTRIVEWLDLDATNPPAEDEA